MGHRDIFRYSHADLYAIPNDRRFYLDTGVLRRRASRLARSPLRHVAYTSSLALIELLVGALRSDREFRARRAAVRVVLEADIPVDWQICDVKIACAFPQFRPSVDVFEPRVARLQELADILARAQALTTFRAALRATQAGKAFEYFVAFDKQMADKHIQASRHWHEEQRRLWQLEGRAGSRGELLAMVGLPANADYQQFREAFRGSAFEKGTNRYVLVQRVCRDRSITNQAIRSELFDTYDGSVDQYTNGLSQWDYEESRGHEPGRNDAADLSHLLHLVANACLVTTDRRFSERVAKVGVEVCGPDSPLAGA